MSGSPPKVACTCGGIWTASVIRDGAWYGIHRDASLDPAMPQPGCRAPDGVYVTGQTAGGGYIGPDGSVSD